MAESPVYDEFFNRLPVDEACDVVDMAFVHASEPGAAKTLAEHLVAPLDRPTSSGQSRVAWELQRVDGETTAGRLREIGRDLASSCNDYRASQIARLALAIMLQRTTKEALDFIADIEACENSRFG